MSKRSLNVRKIGISGKRYKELCGFCEQYPEWVKELKYENHTVKSPIITDMPRGSKRTNSATEELAIRRAFLSRKIQLINDVAEEASEEFKDYLIKSVCYNVSINYLLVCEEMPLSRSAFYDLRRKFFYLLDQRKQN